MGILGGESETFKMFLVMFLGMIILVAVFGFHKSPSGKIGTTSSASSSKSEATKTNLGL
jgi:hypothetical protein